MQELDVLQLAQFDSIAPIEEPADGPVIGFAGVLVADRGRKEFQKPTRGVLANIRDYVRNNGRGLPGR
ncbi:MAG: hypothetical protein KGJ79_04485 [Alphaproteobacteria bacterium]|nr:hypothetical protein [Alphaproteobacteria bacterium]